jgi:predicted unusual protein kinase regulating ubiquinone biosynthesis (AarF/ABC1/UbiB family)
MIKKILPGLIDRGIKLTQLGLNFSLKELELSIPRTKEDFLKLKEKQIHHLVTLLGDLKGGSLKIGQALSMELIQSWPSELRPLIQKLTFKATPHASEEMWQVIQTELKDKIHHVDNFSSIPLASASIGQVHAVTIQGQNAVVKIQYPAISTSLDNDLKMFRFIVNVLKQIQGKDGINFDYFFEEIENSFRQECDYLQELNNLKSFRDLLKGHAVFDLPNPYEEFCTTKVLAMSFCHGVTIDQWLMTKPNDDEKLFVAKNLLDLVIQEIFVWGIVQSDAHGGNYLIQSDQKKIILLDFGATKKLSKEFQLNYKQCLQHTFNENWSELKKHIIAIGWMSPKESAQTFEIFQKMMEHLITAFKGDFDFTSEDYLKKSNKLAWDLARSCQFSSPPKDLIFVHRKLGGLFFLIRRFEVKINLEPYTSLFMGD